MDGYAPVLWFGIWSLNGLCVAISHVCRPTRNPLLYRHIPLFLSSTCICLPFFLPENEAAMRGVVALAACFYAIKTREMVTEHRFSKEPLWIKVAGVLGTFNDVQERRHCEPWISRRLWEIAHEAAILTLHLGCYLVTLRVFAERHVIASALVPIDTSDWSFIWNGRVRVIIGCLTGCLFAFFSLHVYGDALSLVWVTLGLRFPPLMDSPEKSLSVREFWKRWDTVIQKLLTKYVFKPARSAHLPFTFAAALTFFASGLVHILPILVSRGSDWHAASSMMTYFVIQFSVMIMEQPLKVNTWNPWLCRLWTITHLFGPSYFLVFPTLRILQIEF